MVEKAVPLLTYSCSISPQDYDVGGIPRTFSIRGGDTGGFSSNVLKYMPISKIAGQYQMIFNPDELTLTIRKPK